MLPNQSVKRVEEMLQEFGTGCYNAKERRVIWKEIWGSDDYYPKV